MDNPTAVKLYLGKMLGKKGVSEGNSSCVGGEELKTNSYTPANRYSSMQLFVYLMKLKEYCDAFLEVVKTQITPKLKEQSDKILEIKDGQEQTKTLEEFNNTGSAIIRSEFKFTPPLSLKLKEALNTQNKIVDILS